MCTIQDLYFDEFFNFFLSWEMSAGQKRWGHVRMCLPQLTEAVNEIQNNVISQQNDLEGMVMSTLIKINQKSTKCTFRISIAFYCYFLLTFESISVKCFNVFKLSLGSQKFYNFSTQRTFNDFSQLTYLYVSKGSNIFWQSMQNITSNFVCSKYFKCIYHLNEKYLCFHCFC